MGGAALITHVYSSAINSFLFVITVSIAQGGQIIIGYLMGEKRFDEIYKKCFTYLKITYIPSLSAAFILFLFAEPLMSIFTDNADAIALGRTIFGLFILLEIGRVLNIIVISYLRACGDVVFPVVVGVFHMWGVGAVLSFIFAIRFNMGLPGIILGMAIEELSRGIIMIFRWRSKKWVEKGLT
ncbi:MAG: MATE family efflux transporter, partial [Defluviitaleaceae bacterium]|nr:MATE family efflux transporter [Defluviitaleaceae bacterium]